MKEKNKVVGLTLPNFKTNYKASVISKDSIVWWNNRQIEQWNRIESLEIDPHKYSQLIFDKRPKEIQWSKDTYFSTNSAGTIGHTHAQKN